MISEKHLRYIWYFLILFFLLKSGIYIYFKWNTIFEALLWICPFVTILLWWWLIYKNKLLISAVAVLALTAQPIWVYEFVKFILYWVDGWSRINFSAWFSETNIFLPWMYFTLSFLQHTMVIPISIVACYRYGLHKYTLFASYLIAIIAWVWGFIFWNLQENINCMRRPCDSSYYYNSHYSLFDTQAFYYWWEHILIGVLYITLVYLVFVLVFRYIKK